MADTLEEILNQTFTVDNFTNNSLTLITTDSSTRYVIKDIYVNTDNAATLQNMKLYSKGFYLGNFLYGGSGYEIIGTNGNLTLQSDGLTDYYASAYDLRFSILKNSNTDYYDMTIPYVKNTLMTSSVPSISNSLITTGVGSAQTISLQSFVYPDFTAGSTSYYFGRFDVNASVAGTDLHFYTNVTDTTFNNNDSVSNKPITSVPSIPQYVYKISPSSEFDIYYWTFNSTPGGAYVQGTVAYPVNTTNISGYNEWAAGYPRLYPITDSTGNWNGGGLYKFGGTSSVNHAINSLIRFATPTSLRSIHFVQDGRGTTSSLYYWNGSGETSIDNTSHSITGEFETDFTSNQNPYFILVCNSYSSNETLLVLKVYFTETSVGDSTYIVPSNVIPSYNYNIELVKTITLSGDNRLKNPYTQRFLYKNEYYYVATDDKLKSINWKTEKITTITSGINETLTTLSGSMAVPQLQIPSQSTMNSRGYGTRTEFSLRISGIKSI